MSKMLNLTTERRVGDKVAAEGARLLNLLEPKASLTC